MGVAAGCLAGVGRAGRCDGCARGRAAGVLTGVLPGDAPLDAGVKRRRLRAKTTSTNGDAVAGGGGAKRCAGGRGVGGDARPAADPPNDAFACANALLVEAKRRRIATATGASPAPDSLALHRAALAPKTVHIHVVCDSRRRARPQLWRRYSTRRQASQAAATASHAAPHERAPHHMLTTYATAAHSPLAPLDATTHAAAGRACARERESTHTRRAIAKGRTARHMSVAITATPL